MTRAHSIFMTSSMTHHYTRYVLSARPAAYILVYYCGCNDASCGYNGAFLYTASEAGVAALEPADVAAIQKAVAAAGIEGWEYNTMCTPSYAACSS